MKASTKTKDFKKVGFTRMPNLFITSGKLTLQEISILLALHMHIMGNKESKCFVKQETLAQELNVSISTIKRHLDGLVKKGYVHVKKTHYGRCNTYILSETAHKKRIQVINNLSNSEPSILSTTITQSAQFRSNVNKTNIENKYIKTNGSRYTNKEKVGEGLDSEKDSYARFLANGLNEPNQLTKYWSVVNVRNRSLLERAYGITMDAKRAGEVSETLAQYFFGTLKKLERGEVS